MAELMTATTTTGDVDAIAALADAAHGSEPVDPSSIRVTLVPAGYKAVLVDAETLDSVPRRRAGFTVASTPGSFIDQTLRWQTPDTVAYFDPDATPPRLTAVFNPHPSAQQSVDSDAGPAAGWHDNGVLLTLARDKTYDAWMNLCPVPTSWIGQVEFAEFLEQYASSITSPDGATVFEVVKTLTAKRDASFSAATRLPTGDFSVSYSESTDAKAGPRGDLEIPSKIVVMLSPFHGGIPVEFPAFLRFRLTDGRILFRLVWDRAQDRLDEAADAIRVEIATRAGVPVFLGRPITDARSTSDQKIVRAALT